MITQIATTAQHLDWKGWLLGIWSAFIVGATGSIGSGVGGTIVGVQGLKNYFILMGSTFLASGVFSLAAYLHNHPAPAPWDGTTERRSA